MTLRIRCDVLKALAIHGPTTSLELAKYLPKLEAAQIRKAIYRLLDQDRIQKVGKAERSGSNGRPQFFCEVRDKDEWMPTRAKKTGPKKGRQNYRESPKAPSAGTPAVVRFRDRKIRLLQRLMDHTSGAERDLLIGILADYGQARIALTE